MDNTLGTACLASSFHIFADSFSDITYNIQTLATTHEGKTFDIKSARIVPKVLAIVLVAMANADGGCGAIGIDLFPALPDEVENEVESKIEKQYWGI